MYGNAHDKLTESGDWRECIDLHNHRYLREDIVYGLGFLLSAAAYAGVKAPLAAGLYALAAASVGEDFAACAPRTLEALGLAAWSRAALGAGRMGRGLAHAFAYAGHDVWLVDIKPRKRADLAHLERTALTEIEGSLSALASLGVFDANDIPSMLTRVHFVGLDAASATLAECDVCFEGVPERMDAKQDALRFP